MYAINKQGLREKPNYDELVNYLQNKQEKIVYPDRFAKRVRESPQLSNLLDGEGFDIHDIQDQQIRQAKEIAKHLAIIQADGDAKILNTASREPSRVDNNIADHTDSLQDQAEQISEVINDHNTNQQNQRQSTLQQSISDLDIVHQQNQDALLGMAPPPGLTQPSSSSSTDPLPQVDATNIPVPRGIIEETSTSSGSGNGNGASSGSSQPLEERQPLISLEDIERMVKLERKSVSELRQLAREAVRNKNTNTDTFFLNRIGKKSELIVYIIEPKSASSSAPPPGPPQRPITSELIKTLITQYKKDRKDPQ